MLVQTLYYTTMLVQTSKFETTEPLEISTFTLPHPNSPYQGNVQINISNRDQTLTHSNKTKHFTSYSETP
jgi:hypothetical protein